jgi:excisionase family DNA binding protein
MSKKKPPSPLPPLDLLQRYTVTETARYLRVSRTWVFKLVADDKLDTLKEGRRRFVFGTAIAKLSTPEEKATA